MKKSLLLCSVALLLSLKSFAQEDTKNQLNSFMDQWHLAAAQADEEVFFGSMQQDGIYLGTDQSEKWTRDEMREWSKEYFDRESAWSFKAIKRDIYLSEDGSIAWFNEKLDTWMGICKGTGVLEKTDGEWKIALYDLSVTIDNDKIQKFIELAKD